MYDTFFIVSNAHFKMNPPHDHVGGRLLLFKDIFCNSCFGSTYFHTHNYVLSFMSTC